jgi:hypothetical protein
MNKRNPRIRNLTIFSIKVERLFYNTRFILFSNGCKYVFMPLTKFIQHGNDELLSTTYISSSIKVDDSNKTYNTKFNPIELSPILNTFRKW